MEWQVPKDRSQSCNSGRRVDLSPRLLRCSGAPVGRQPGSGRHDRRDATVSTRVHRIVQQGSSYYTLAYTPTNREWNGKYRKIEVKAATPAAELTYRRGYKS